MAIPSSSIVTPDLSEPEPQAYSLAEGLRWRSMDPSKRANLQVKLLRDHIRQAGCSHFYHELFAREHIRSEDISSLADLARLPLTDRRDMDNASRDFCAVSQDEIVDLALTSGTTGPPVQVPYTRNDLDRLAYNEAMAFHGAGLTPRDTCLVTVTLDRCFIAGLAYWSGAVRLGATAVRSGPGQPARQWELIEQLRPTVLVGVPSFLIRVAEWAAERGFDPRATGIDKIVTIGEPIRRPDMNLTPLGQLLADRWDALISSSYGATELETGICECTAGRGGHVHPELSLAEIVDEQGNLVPDGEPGELVVTPLGVEGFPLVRFRTGDIARKYSDNCPCGWQTERIGPIEGRVAQRLKMRGTTLYPEAVFQVLQEIDRIQASYVEVRSAYDLADEVRVVIGGNGTLDAREIESLLQARLRVKPEVVVREYEQVVAAMTPVGGSKPKRFFDYRDR